MHVPYGVRVPTFVVSPWTPPGKGPSITLDHCSIVKTVLAWFCADTKPFFSDRVNASLTFESYLSEPAPRDVGAPSEPPDIPITAPRKPARRARSSPNPCSASACALSRSTTTTFRAASPECWGADRRLTCSPTRRRPTSSPASSKQASEQRPGRQPSDCTDSQRVTPSAAGLAGKEHPGGNREVTPRCVNRVPAASARSRPLAQVSVGPPAPAKSADVTIPMALARRTGRRTVVAGTATASMVSTNCQSAVRNGSSKGPSTSRRR